MKYDVEQMLGQAFCEEYYKDCDKERIWRAAIQKRESCRRKRGRLVPILVGAVAAVAVLAAVPPVRAAVADFFASVGEYFAAAQEDRPDAAGVVIQKPQTGQAQYRILSEEGSWVEDITVSIDEALFDGERLYIKYTVTDPEKMLTPIEEQDALEPGQEVRQRTFISQVVFPGTGLEVMGYPYANDSEGGVFHAAAAYVPFDWESAGDSGSAGPERTYSETNDGKTVDSTDVENGSGSNSLEKTFPADLEKLSGSQNAVFEVFFSDDLVTGQENGGSMGTSACVGSISIPITIEADAQTRTVEAPGRFPVNGDVVCSDPVNLEVDTARKPDIRYQNIPLRLDGTEVMFRKITVKPAEIVLDISIIPPDGMENWKDVAQLDFKAYLDGAQMKQARVEYARWYFGDGKTYQMRFVIPFPPADPGTLELVPVMSYMEKVNSAPPPENELFSVDREAGDTVRQKEQVLEGSKITIDLSK